LICSEGKDLDLKNTYSPKTVFGMHW
jgi:hypothetical protein